METDIRLQASWLLRCFRAGVVLLACCAVTMAGLPGAITLILISGILCETIRLWRKQPTVARIRLRTALAGQVGAGDSKEAQKARLSGDLTLTDGRLVEVVLLSSYCLWWLQVLFLKSYDGTRTVVILPDSSNCHDRRLLRKITLL